jgi:hypothetical protein
MVWFSYWVLLLGLQKAIHGYTPEWHDSEICSAPLLPYFPNSKHRPDCGQKELLLVILRFVVHDLEFGINHVARFRF